jgi:tetratricopeptide (TPR) repeat protein
MILDGILRRKKKSDDASMALERGDYATAIASYRRSLAQQPRDAALWHRRIGETLAEAGRPAEAVEELFCAAGHLQDAGRMFEALSVYREIRRIEPDHRLLRERLAEISYDGGITASQETTTGPVTLGVHLKSKAPLFSDLLLEDLELLLDKLSILRLGAGRSVFVEGRPTEALFLVARGEVALTMSGDGQPHEVSRVSSGSHFGRVGERTGEASTSAAITSRPTEMLVLTRSAFEDIAASRPRLRDTLNEYQSAGAPPSQSL